MASDGLFGRCQSTLKETTPTRFISVDCWLFCHEYFILKQPQDHCFSLYEACRIWCSNNVENTNFLQAIFLVTSRVEAVPAWWSHYRWKPCWIERSIWEKSCVTPNRSNTNQILEVFILLIFSLPPSPDLFHEKLQIVHGVTSLENSCSEWIIARCLMI